MKPEQSTPKPDYAVHTVAEGDVTVDWFYGRGHGRTKVRQGVLVVIGWFFAILPIVVTESALAHRHDAGGWWSYREGFDMWDVTIRTLGLLLVVFVLGFLTLYLVNRRISRRQARENTFDEERLAARLALAEDLYTSKYGDEESRLQQRTVRIEPYSDFETFELRDLYRTYGVD